MKRKSLVMLAAIMLFMFLTACGAEKQSTVTDREGNEVVVGSNNAKIISTAPSNTEILIGLGLADKIIAVDNYSPTEELKEGITQIDFLNPDAEVIIGLEPDLLIASGHNKTGNEDPFALIKAAGIPVVYIPSSNSIQGIYEDIDFIASITNTTEQGDKMKKTLMKEIDGIKEIAKNIEKPKSVYFEISPAPSIYTSGKDTFQNEIVTLIGATNIFKDETGWISPSPEAIVDRNPQVILTNVNYIDKAVDEILSREAFKEIEAVKARQVYLVDANTTSRPSQHVIKAIKEIAKAVYPEYYE